MVGMFLSLAFPSSDALHEIKEAGLIQQHSGVKRDYLGQAFNDRDLEVVNPQCQGLPIQGAAEHLANEITARLDVVELLTNLLTNW